MRARFALKSPLPVKSEKNDTIILKSPADGVPLSGYIGARIPLRSLFHEEKFAFLDFGVRDTLKILKIF